MQTLATHGARTITTRDLSKNPSKALREATDQPLIVMRHQRPIACLVPIEQWSELVTKLKLLHLDANLV
ncbi:Antitoxin [Pararobbsia alpina]|jgi:PHD/YefM family antitoxin component YafN of YafNO toxin-antitoxin module|uniref:type II toxin-antitoxin system Phd/YefM family antitoxin n=1 Tax=Pararobbsia alpina TaxID=621374 RepID=UPI0039A51F93